MYKMWTVLFGFFFVVQGMPLHTKEYRMRLDPTEWVHRTTGLTSLLDTLQGISLQCPDCYAQWNTKDRAESIEHYVILDTEESNLSKSGFLLKEIKPLWPEITDASLELKFSSADVDVVQRNEVRPRDSSLLEERREQDFHPCATWYSYSGKALETKPAVENMKALEHYFSDILKRVNVKPETQLLQKSERYDWIFQQKANLMKHEPFSLTIIASYESWAEARVGNSKPLSVEVSIVIEGDGRSDHLFSAKSTERISKFYELMAHNVNYICENIFRG
eukprot:TRINITY_DN8526_c0_g1_i2.p1 TRINITY_DN8526_c0_g1~~TRINITY_DN8526_c0_g1_i2.p1  ORF type:complete len:297 (+),score=32.75 TRINITY_DN8526_c0_g1_i2:61-891(+)